MAELLDAIHRAILYVVTEPIFLFGFFANFLFMMRFVVQWVHSERRRQSVIPLAFWFFSVGGGCAMLVYGIFRRDPVIILGQGLGLVIYSRNLWIIFGPQRHQRQSEALEKARQLLSELDGELQELTEWGDRSPAVDKSIAALNKLISRS
jgi:lipid-A-disaccharide synthase-like uncharacterized protein